MENYIHVSHGVLVCWLLCFCVLALREHFHDSKFVKSMHIISDLGAQCVILMIFSNILWCVRLLCHNTLSTPRFIK